MRKKSALVTFLAATVLCSSSIYALGSNIGLGAKSLLLYPIGKSSQAQMEVSTGKSSSVSRSSGAFLVGPQLNWCISDDFTLTVGSYFCVKSFDYLSTLKVKGSLHVNALVSQPAADLGTRRGSGLPPQACESASDSGSLHDGQGVSPSGDLEVKANHDSHESSSSASGNLASLLPNSFDDGELRKMIETAFSKHPNVKDKVFKAKQKKFDQYDYPRLLSQLGIEDHPEADNLLHILKATCQEIRSSKNKVGGTGASALPSGMPDGLSAKSKHEEKGIMGRMQDALHLGVHSSRGVSGAQPDGPQAPPVSEERVDQVTDCKEISADAASSPVAEPHNPANSGGEESHDAPVDGTTAPAGALDAPSSDLAEDFGVLNKFLSGNRIEVSVSLRQHIPVVVGAEYNLYSSDIFSLGVFGSVGFAIWTAKALLIDSSAKAGLICNSAEGSYSLIGFGGLKFGFKFGSATIALSGGYGYFGKPDFKWAAITNPHLPRLDCAVHGLAGSVEIGFEF